LPGKKPLMLVILDGWGLAPPGPGNVISQARLPNYRYLLGRYPHTQLLAAGKAVGLPEGQMGNSEVGHLNLGAGRIVYQDLTRISQAIETGEFFHNPVLLKAMEEAKAKGSILHLMGLVSDGGVHSHLEHLLALVQMARKQGVERVFLHAFLDGRDVPPASAATYLEKVERAFLQMGLGQLASLMGRYYAMDRDKRWDRTEKAYRALVAGEGHFFPSWQAALDYFYKKGITDEFVEPTLIAPGGAPVALVGKGEVVIFFNFRADRARQLTWAFVDPRFSSFERPGGYLDPYFVCFTQYDKELDLPVAFPPQNLKNVLGEVLAHYDKRQLRIAETEKYAHVTFFFNGGREDPFPGEDRLLIPSPKVATYDQKPEMSAPEVTEAVLERLTRYDFILLNFANPDMVGHTGSLPAAIAAVEAVDRCLGKIAAAMEDLKAPMIVTADHGNVEEMLEPDGQPHTAHTSNPVPFILAYEPLRFASLRSGILADVAPTVLDLMGLPQPEEMTGRGLILKEGVEASAYKRRLR